MITNLLRATIAFCMVSSGVAIVCDKTRKSYDPLAFALIAFGIDLLYWSLYYGPISFPGFVRWVRGVYLGFATLLWLAVNIQQWMLNLKFRKSAKERKIQRARARSRAFQDDLDTDDSPTEVPSLDNDD